MRLTDLDELAVESDLVTSHVELIKNCKMIHKSGCAAPTCEECFARLFKYYDHLFNIIDAEPVKHGKWLDVCCEVKCSNCGEVYNDEIFLMRGNINYCPNCGAEME